MRIIFQLEDEKTVTNDTVKVFVSVTGPNSAARAELEKRARNALHDFIPAASWAFAGFETLRSNNVPIFRVQASTRIPADLNDDLQRRADDFENSTVTLQVTSIDQSVPTHLLREGYGEIRSNILKLAQEECERLSSKDSSFRVLEINFTENEPDVRGKFSASTANYSTAPAGGAAIGYSAKINSVATVVLTDGYDEATALDLREVRE